MFQYRITLERLAGSSPETPADSLTFTMTNHDELPKLGELTLAKGIADENTSASFIVGLKLFAEVVLE